MEVRVSEEGKTGRIKVLAANPRTARGFSGDLILDEFAFHEDSQAIWEAAERVKIEPIVEAFNLFNVTNVLGFSKSNYSGFSNVLVRDSNDPTSAGFLRSSSFGQPVTTAGGVFGSGGPRAFQFAARVTF